MSHMKNRDSNKGRRQQRQAEALVRQDLAKQKTTAERLAKFNATLGVGIGALKERARLAAEAKKVAEAVKAPPATTPAEAPSASQEPSKKAKKAKSPKKPKKAS